MPFYFRKSVKLGLLRVNFSKSGISISAGVTGARIGTGPRGAYIHAGRNGVYYRKSLGTPRAAHSNLPDFDRRDTTSDHVISTADVEDLVELSNREILERINRRAQATPISPFLIGITALGLAFLLSSIVPVIVGGLLACLALYVEKALQPVELVYDLEPDFQKRFEAIKTAIQALGTSEKVWRALTKEATSDWKRNAGAGSLVQRKSAVIGSLIPPFIRTNIETYGIDTGKLKLFFFPDQVFVFQNGRYGAVSYDALSIEGFAIRFIEEEAVPEDGHVLDYTWKYVRKDGGPDRRFSNNRRLPIMRYGFLKLTSQSGLNLHLYASNAGTIRPFVNVFETLHQIRAAERENLSAHQSVNHPSNRKSQIEDVSGADDWRGWPGSSSQDWIGWGNESRKTTRPKVDATEIQWACEILGITGNASASEVREAHQRLAQRYHPDKVLHLGEEFRSLAEQRMKEVNRAYLLLKEV